ncbi:tetratricopeptide repeat-containing sensor histidine kinase [Mucilaginibacter flavus]|uniref:tetratricopeptide repeat-containing sensor histidine kinase n=1 Tax=Mucilaginibacter flavus TaxID=931504 RepID=UPI0025B300E1|nr:histidine kinase dimerization/phosphoacceptor domain -containing protein [Mucilaginibacter flavus]MDN3581266.1 histidine kinase dimerization/phosphoacceptor domain -containing protein [Mucilaginibacter flavus]
MFKFLLLLCPLFIAVTTCQGQIANERDLRKYIDVTQRMENDTNRLSKLASIAFYYNSHDDGHNHAHDTALMYFNKVYQLSKQLNPPSGHFMVEKCLGFFGFYYMSLRDNERGTQIYLKAIASLHAKRKSLEEARVWYNLGYYTLAFRSGNADSIAKRFKQGINACKISLQIMEHVNKTNLAVMIRKDLANTYVAAGYPDSGKNECLQLLKKYANSRFPEVDEAYYILSAINRNDGNLNISLKYILKGVEHMQKTNDTTKAELVYGELAEVYQELGQTENSIAAYRKCIQAREKQPNFPQTGIIRTVGFLVQGLIKEGKANEALHEINDAEKKHPPESDFVKGLIAEIKANCYEAQNRLRPAEEKYLEMYRLLSLPNPDGIYLNIGKLDMARFYLKQNKFDKTSFYLKDLTASGFTIGQRLELLSLNYKADSAKGDYLGSLNHLLAYKTMNDSIFSITKNKQIAELQIIYKTEQREKDISLLKKDGLLQRELVYHANTVRNLTFAGIALLVICMAFLYKGYRIKQRNNHFLNQLVIEKDGLIEDKEWLIKEIHHRVKNNLQMVMSLLQQQAAYVSNEKALEAIQNCKNRMRSVALIHQKLYQSDSLDLISMPEYIDEQINFLKDSFDLDKRILFEKHVDAIELDVSQAMPLALIFNEAATNAIKYAYPGDKTGTIKIHLFQKDNGFALLKIIDQGTGIKADFNFDKIKSLGMNLMKGLSKQLGGKFEIDNLNGVRVSVTFKIIEPATPVTISNKGK